MRFQRRPLPSRSAVVKRVLGVLLLAILIFVPRVRSIHFLGAPIYPVTPDSLTFTSEILGAAVFLAALGAQLEESVGRLRADLTVAAFAYLSTRAISVGFANPWTLLSWSPYPLAQWMSSELVPLLIMFAQSLLLRPLWPIWVRDANRFRTYVALFLVAVVLISWDILNYIVGPASAALIVTLVVALAMVVATNRRFLMFGIVVCAGFLSVSALAQQDVPADITGFKSPDAVDIVFRIVPPTGDSLDTTDLKMWVLIQPAAATPFLCPSEVSVLIFFEMLDPLSAQDRKTQAVLLRSSYMLGVTRKTLITDSRGSAVGHSRVIDAPGGGVRTKWVGKALNVSPTGGDEFNFNAPLQSNRSMGTCYVEIPRLQGDIIWRSASHFDQPQAATVELFPELGSKLDLAETPSHPVAEADNPSDPRNFEWNCFDNGSRSGRRTQHCPALAVVVADWSSPYGQIALIVVGALIAIAAERWLGGRDNKRTHSKADNGAAGGAG